MPSETWSAITGLGMASIRSRATDQSVRMSFPNWLVFTLPEQTVIVTRTLCTISSNGGVFQCRRNFMFRVDFRSIAPRLCARNDP